MERPEGFAALALAVLGLSQVLYLATVAALGLRLLARARRARELPEALLSLHFLLCCTLGYALLSSGLGAALQPGVLPPRLIQGLVATGQLLSVFGVWSAVAFTQRVFRRDAAWARALVPAFAAVLAVGYAGSLARGEFSGRVDGPWFRMLYGAYMAAAAWVMVEPIRYWILVRRRVPLGLADPIVVDRFLLWGGGSLCRFGMLAVGAVPVSMPRLATDPAIVVATFTATALLGLAVASAYWLAFFPPRAYLRFVEARTRTAPA